MPLRLLIACTVIFTVQENFVLPRPLKSCCLLTSGLLDNVTVLIGIAYGGRAIAGVINQPFYNYQVLTKLNDPGDESSEALTLVSSARD